MGLFSKIGLCVSVAYIFVYFAISWASQYGFLTPKIVVMPFHSHGTIVSKEVGGNIAASVAARLVEIRLAYSSEFNQHITDNLPDSFEFDLPIPMPDSLAFGSASAVAMKPISIGPLVIPLNRVIFDALRGLAELFSAYPSEVVTGSIDGLEENWTIRLELNGRFVAIAKDSQQNIDQLIDDVAHQVVVDRLKRAGDAAIELRSWNSLQLMTHGLWSLRHYVETRDSKALSGAAARLRNVVSLETDWELPRLQLARVDLHLREKESALREALEMFRAVRSTKQSMLSRDDLLEDPTFFLATLGQLTTTNQILSRFDHECTAIDELGAEYLALFSWAQDAFEANRFPMYREKLQLSRGVASMVLAEFLTFHSCADLAGQQFVSLKHKTEDLFLEAQISFKAQLNGRASHEAAKNLGIAYSYQARAMIKEGRIENDNDVKRVDLLLREAIQLRKQSLQQNEGRYVRSAIASDLLRLAKLTNEPLRRDELIREALRQLLQMSFLQSGLAQEFANYRVADVQFAMGNSIAASNQLGVALKRSLRRSDKTTVADETGAPTLLTDHDSAVFNLAAIRYGIALVDDLSDQVQMTKIIGKLKSGMSFDPYSVFPLFVVADAMIESKNLGEAERILGIAKARLAGNFWRGPYVALKHSLLELKLDVAQKSMGNTQDLLGYSKSKLAEIQTVATTHGLAAALDNDPHFLWDVAAIHLLSGEERELRSLGERFPIFSKLSSRYRLVEVRVQ